MPQLKCTVQTCVHNQQFLCNLDAIEVGGSEAKTARETCCDSFEERKKDDTYSNVTGTASDLNKIDCKAVECQYNDHCECHAGKISIEGSNACECEGTECATFQYGK